MGYRDITVLADSIELIEKRTSSYGADLRGADLRDANLYDDNLYGADLQIDLVNADVDSMLSDIGIDEAIEYHGADDLLDKIGKHKAIEYFGIEEKE